MYSQILYRCSNLMKLAHIKCRNVPYPRTNGKILRTTVPDDKVSWDVEWPEYKPQYYTSETLLNKTWADPVADDSNFNPKWNSIDGNVDRTSFLGVYKIKDSLPLNPVGRTGLRGRGVLGRWGPNHAADPIVTRWKRDLQGSVQLALSKKPILQFIAIKRRDCNEIAIPGGMVDPGEMVTQTLKREFLEEALDSMSMTSTESEKLKAQVNNFFSNGMDVFKGYVDDPRNTDNTWIETVAQNFHDEDGSFVSKLNLTAGDDAAAVSWVDISKDLQLYASHLELIERVAEKHNAHCEIFEMLNVEVYIGINHKDQQ